MGMTKEERIVKQLTPVVKLQGDSMALPNYSVVAGADRVHAKVNNIQVNGNQTVAGTLGVTGDTTATKVVISADSGSGTVGQVRNIIYTSNAIGTLTASDYVTGTIALIHAA